MNRALLRTTMIAALLAALLLSAAAFGFGRFKPARHLAITGGDTYPVAIADFNRDGRKDVAVGSESDDLVNLLFGKPGGFKPARQFPAGDYPFGISARDFNRDGRPDMAVVDYDGDKIGLLRSKPGGFRGPQLFDTGPTAVDEDPVAVASADFNRDRRPDLAVANSATGTVGILIGKPGGFKAPHTVSTGGADATPSDVTTGDFNADGKPDVAALNYYRPNGDAGVQAAILLGRGGGSFRAPIRSDAGTEGAYGFVKGRFNPGRKLDLVVSDCDGNDKLYLLRGKGNGHFRAPVSYPTIAESCGYEPAAADFNLDERLDVANVSEDSGKVAISFQKRSGGFGSPRKLGAVSEAYSVAAGRLNGDPAPDLAIPDYSNPDTAILINRR
jgi:FG-GAP-like repeat